MATVSPLSLCRIHPLYAQSKGSASIESSTFINAKSYPHSKARSEPKGRGVAGARASVAPASDGLATSSTVTKVKLGKSDVEVPILGIGAWSWGDKFYWNDGDWGDRKLKETKQAFDASIAAGLTFVDTAEVYGTKQFGAEDSETLVGRFIKESEGKFEERAIVATKYAALPWRLGKASVVHALRNSLSRLSLSSVDLYQLHWPGIWGNEGYIDGLAECVELGLTLAVGVSNYSEERLRRAHAQLAKRGIPLAANQVHYNLLYRKPELNGVKKACDELGISLIAYSPLSQGILCGKYSAQNPPTGPRAGLYTKQFLIQAEPILAKLKELGEIYGKTPTQISLNWLIVQGNVIPIPGVKNKKQAEEFQGALGWSLTSDDVEELRALASKVPSVPGFPVENF